ncbi:hypothetical protein FNAPI_6777 [Fusarium napiforme]|uniref:Uncharacterized protein n=1 Tax=Fusarium napiforme TaxID=42672 RepID=A0A8H5JFR7_9HYPO|nr:hypothetical protein FNAPI_6777 [Fusarium napiforme]
MSQQESLEAWMATHSQVCKTIENKMRGDIDAALRQAYTETGDAFGRALGAARERQSTEMERTFENLEETLREAGISHYNSSRRSLQDKDLEITQLREEYEAKLKAKDDEITALKESLNELRGSCRDEDAIITTTMETNKRQLEEQTKHFEAKEKAMNLSMARRKIIAERCLQNKEIKLERRLLQTNQEIELEKGQLRRLSEKLGEYCKTIEVLQKNGDELSVDKKELAETQNKLLAIGKCISSNEISEMLYKLSLETSAFKISPFLESCGWSFFLQVLDVIVKAGNTNRMRTLVDEVSDVRARCFPSVCTMNDVPKALITGVCKAHNNKCPKIRVVVEKGGNQRTVYFDL